MSSNQVHPLPESSAPTDGPSVDVTRAASCLPPLKFCSLFTAKAMDAQPSLPGLAYQLLPTYGSSAARLLNSKIVCLAKRHSRYQFLMNFRLHGSRFAAALSILCHVVCVIVLVFELLLLYHEVTGNNSVSNGASAICSTQCENSGVCSSFEAAPSSNTSSSNATTSRPPDSCSCLPGFYGAKCQLDLRSDSAKRIEYSFSTALFKKVYDLAMIYMVFITACLCVVLLSFMHSIHAAFLTQETISRISPVHGSIRYHSFASFNRSSDSYGCSSIPDSLPPLGSSLNAFPSASEVDVLQVMFENSARGTFMVSYKWGGWSQSVARSFFHLLPGVWLDMQNLLPGQVVTTACARAAAQATVVFVFFTRNYVSRKNCMCEMNSLLDIHCASTPAHGKHAIVFVLSEALEPTDSWVANDSACDLLYASIIQRLASSPSVTIVYWDHRGMANNWGVLQQPLNGDKIQLLVNKYRFEHMDALVLLQLLTGPRLRAISSKIALRDNALDPSALNSSMVTRVFYSLLPETSAEHSSSGAYAAIFQVLKRVEPSFVNMSHVAEIETEDVAVIVHEGGDDDEGARGTAAAGANCFMRTVRAIVQPFSYLRLLLFLARSFLPERCAALHLACDLHRQWTNLLYINLEHLSLHNLASLQITLANTEAAAKRCCEDGSSGTFGLSSLVAELLKFFRVQMSFKFTTPIISLVSAREIVSTLLYIAIFLAVLYSFLFLYFNSALFSIFTQISEGIFYLGVSGSAIILITKLFRMLIHSKLTMPLVSGLPIFSLLHDALLLRKSHKSLHPLLLSTDVANASDSNIVAALCLQTPICSAFAFLMKHNAVVSSCDDHAFRHLGSSLAGATRRSLQNGIFPSISVGSGGELTTTGSSLEKIMRGKMFKILVDEGKLEHGQVALDWWCGFNISGKRFSILHQLGLAPTITLVYVSDQKTPTDVLGEHVFLNPHLPLHDSGPIGMYMEMCEDLGCISTRVLLLNEVVESDKWPVVLESCGALQGRAGEARFAQTVVVFDIGGSCSKSSFVSFLDWKQQRSVNVSWQAYTNISFSALKFGNDTERSVISNNFILCPERHDACQGATHLRMRLADALWTTINMASRL